MPPPLTVLPQDLQVALLRLRRVPNRARLDRLEQAQPELAALLMETAGDLNHRLSRRLGPASLRRFTRGVEGLGLLLVETTLVAHVRHWQQHHRRHIPPTPPSL